MYQENQMAYIHRQCHGVLPAHPSPVQGGGVDTQPEAPQNQPNWISPRQEWLNNRKPKRAVSEAKCNMTAENVNCPVHGLKECWKERYILSW